MQEYLAFKWNKICFPNTQKFNYILGTNWTERWRLSASRWSCWDDSVSVSELQSSGPSINVIFFYFTFRLLPFDDAGKRKENDSEHQTIIGKKGTVTQKDRGSLYTLNKMPRCINLLKRRTVFVNLVQRSKDKVEIAVEFRQMSLSNFKAN